MGSRGRGTGRRTPCDARARFYSEDSDDDEGYVGGDFDYGHLGCRNGGPVHGGHIHGSYINGGYVDLEAQEQQPPRVADRFLPQTTPYAGPSRYMANLSVQPKQSTFGPFKSGEDFPKLHPLSTSSLSYWL